MEIKEMNFDELETRRAELATEIAEADSERLDAINAELDAIEARKKEIKAEAEERAKVVEEIINAPEPKPIIEERNNKTMTSKEIRSSQEYIDAYVEYAKKNFDLDRVSNEAREILVSGMEKRVLPEGLFTQNVSGGTVAVPTYVEERINTAWENDEIMRRVRRTFIPGNVKVGYEYSASGAVIHNEGGTAIGTENLVLGYAELVPVFVKKMVEVSHSALALTGTAFLDYLYDEIEYQLIKKCADTVLAKVCNSDACETHYMAGETITTADIVNAEGNLGGEARNVVFITTRAIASSIKANVLSSHFAYDPFYGMEVLYASMPEGVNGIVIDLSGVQANFPEGGEPKFIFDEYTKAPQNIVRIIGRLMMGADLVAMGKAVKIISA